MTKKYSLSSPLDIKRVAACLLGSAVKDLFPKVLIGENGPTATGFYCDFYTDLSFSSAVLQQVEERMAQAIWQAGAVESKEMVPLAAYGYFSAQKEPYLASWVRGASTQTVALLSMGGKMIPMADVVEVKSLKEIGEFKVHGVEELGRHPRRIRLYGSLFSDKEEKKNFIKNKSHQIPSSHIILGRERGWFEEGESGHWIWFPPGYKIRSLLLQVFQELSEKEGFPWLSIEREVGEFFLDDLFSVHKDFFSSTGIHSVSECLTICESEDKTFFSGLLDTLFKQRHITHLFCERENLLEKTISCLHFVTKIFKILGFAFQIVLVGKQKRGIFETDVLSSAIAQSGLVFSTETNSNASLCIEWRVQDKMGVYWPVSCIYTPRKSVLKQQGYVALPFSLFLSIERVVALLIESTKGNLPSFLAPCQVVIVPVRKDHEGYAQALSRQLCSRGVRVKVKGQQELKKALHIAKQEGVPYIVVVGDKELESQTVALRQEEGGEPLCLSLDELVKMVLNRSNDSEL